MLTKRHLDRETLQPLVIRNTIPVCMSQYERIFATTRCVLRFCILCASVHRGASFCRIPGEEIDEIYHLSASDRPEVLLRD